MKTIILILQEWHLQSFRKAIDKYSWQTNDSKGLEKAINSNIGDVVLTKKEVFDLINSLGGKAILTDPNLPSGTVRIYSALNKINSKVDFDCIINLQGDMPLIEPEQIKSVIIPLEKKYSIGTLATNLIKKLIIQM